VEKPALMPSQPGRRRLEHMAHVLVVEDNPVTLKFFSTVLDCDGYWLTLASTAKDAKEALDRELPDLVILDLHLPDVYGLSVCQHLRQLLGGEDIPVLVVTIEEDREQHARALRAGVDDFLRKPIIPVELSSRARSLIRLREVRRELRSDRESIVHLHAQKEHLLQYVAHDMKNLLGATQATLDLMSEEDGSSRSLRYQDRMRQSLRAMLAMVKDLLDISIGDQVELVADFKTIEIGPWLEKVIHEYESLAVRRNRRFHLDFPPGLKVEADPHLLHRAVSNLLENAIAFAPEGSQIEVQVLAEAGERGPQIRVSDEGPGIPVEQMGEIFDRFVRLKNPEDDRSGRGLGLAFCRLVMTMHHGRIWVEDNRPKGSCFILELPRSSAGKTDCGS
jgi:two-component system, sensor histidine kinase and response regulator